MYIVHTLRRTKQTVKVVSKVAVATKYDGTSETVRKYKVIIRHKDYLNHIQLRYPVLIHSHWQRNSVFLDQHFPHQGNCDSKGCWSDREILEGPVSNKGRKLWSHIKAKCTRVEQLASCPLKINTTSLYRPEAILNDVTRRRRNRWLASLSEYCFTPRSSSKQEVNRGLKGLFARCFCIRSISHLHDYCLLNSEIFWPKINLLVDVR